VNRLLLWPIGALLAFPAPAAPHQLDEFLQATRVALARDRLVLEIDLTPGVKVASRVCALIDTDGDRKISTAEGRAYAQRVLEDVVLRLDGERRRLTLVRADFPSLGEMGAGLGTIRLEAKADAAVDAPGGHQLSYQNDHQPEIGAYLVNALVPETSRIEITGQRRDKLQRGIRLDYTVASSGARRLSWLIVAALGLSALVVYRRL
jgi:hypothetical protein